MEASANLETELAELKAQRELDATNARSEAAANNAEALKQALDEGNEATRDAGREAVRLQNEASEKYVADLTAAHKQGDERRITGQREFIDESNAASQTNAATLVAASENNREALQEVAEVTTAAAESNTAAAREGAKKVVEADARRSDARQEVVDASSETSSKYVEDVTEARRQGDEGRIAAERGVIEARNEAADRNAAKIVAAGDSRGAAIEEQVEPAYTWTETGAGLTVPERNKGEKFHLADPKEREHAAILAATEDRLLTARGIDPIALRQDLALAKKADESQAEAERTKFHGVANFAADIIIPGYGTARHWQSSSNLQRGFGLGLDAVSVIPLGALAAKSVRAGAGLARGLKAGGKALAVGPIQTIRHPIEAAKSVGRFGDVVLGPKTVPVSALESMTSTTRLPVKAFKNVDDAAGDLPSVTRHTGASTVDHGTDAAAAAKFASDELTQKLTKGEAATVDVGGVQVKMTPTPFQKATDQPAVFTTGPDITPFTQAGGSRGFVSAEGQSFFAPGYLSRFDAQSAFGNVTPPGGRAGAAVIRDPELIEQLASSGKTYTPNYKTADELVEIESTLPQPLNYAEPSQILKTYSDPNVVRPGADAVDEYARGLEELGTAKGQKQAQKLRETGAVDYGRQRDLAVIGEPLSLREIYSAKLRGAAENIRRLNPAFKHTDIRSSSVDDLAKAADDLAAAGKADEAAFVRSQASNIRNVDDLYRSADDLARGGLVNEGAALRREADDALRRLDDAGREAGGVTGTAGIARGALSAIQEERARSASTGDMNGRGPTSDPLADGERSTVGGARTSDPLPPRDDIISDPPDTPPPPRDDIISDPPDTPPPRDDIISDPPDTPPPPRDDIISDPPDTPPPPRDDIISDPPDTPPPPRDDIISDPPDTPPPPRDDIISDPPDTPPPPRDDIISDPPDTPPPPRDDIISDPPDTPPPPRDDIISDPPDTPPPPRDDIISDPPDTPPPPRDDIISDPPDTPPPPRDDIISDPPDTPPPPRDDIISDPPDTPPPPRDDIISDPPDTPPPPRDDIISDPPDTPPPPRDDIISDPPDTPPPPRDDIISDPPDTPPPPRDDIISDPPDTPPPPRDRDYLRPARYAAAAQGRDYLRPAPGRATPTRPLGRRRTGATRACRAVRNAPPPHGC